MKKVFDFFGLTTVETIDPEYEDMEQEEYEVANTYRMDYEPVEAG